MVLIFYNFAVLKLVLIFSDAFQYFYDALIFYNFMIFVFVMIFSDVFQYFLACCNTKISNVLFGKRGIPYF